MLTGLECCLPESAMKGKRLTRITGPGSGRACGAKSFAPNVIIFIDCEKRQFVKKLDSLKIPGRFAEAFLNRLSKKS
jgi:hypothetical protein